MTDGRLRIDVNFKIDVDCVDLGKINQNKMDFFKGKDVGVDEDAPVSNRFADFLEMKEQRLKKELDERSPDVDAERETVRTRAQRNISTMPAAPNDYDEEENGFDDEEVPSVRHVRTRFVTDRSISSVGQKHTLPPLNAAGPGLIIEPWSESLGRGCWKTIVNWRANKTPYKPNYTFFIGDTSKEQKRLQMIRDVDSPAQVFPDTESVWNDCLDNQRYSESMCKYVQALDQTGFDFKPLVELLKIYALSRRNFKGRQYYDLFKMLLRDAMISWLEKKQALSAVDKQTFISDKQSPVALRFRLLINTLPIDHDEDEAPISAGKEKADDDKRRMKAKWIMERMRILGDPETELMYLDIVNCLRWR